MKKIMIGIGVLALITLGLVIGLRLQPASNRSHASRASRLDAEQAYASGDFAAALAIAEQLLEKSPQSVSLQMLAAESASKCNEFETALAHYAQIPDHSPKAVLARWGSGQVLYQLGKPREALAALDECLRLDPDFVAAHEGKAALLNTLGRRREALPHLLKLLQSDSGTVDHLLQVGNLSKSIFSPAELERLGKLNPQDLSINLPLAIQAREQGQFSRADSLLTALIQQQPSLLEARLQQGWLLVSTDAAALAKWAAELPTDAFENPDAWYLAGQAALQQGDNPSATRYSLEAIERDPDHLQAHLAVARLLQRTGHPERAKAFAERAELLQRLNLALEQIYTSRRYLPPIEEAGQQAYRLGRMWEAIGWSAYALSIDSNLTWPKDLLEKVRPQIRRDSPRTLPEYNLAAAFPWKQEYPLPPRPRDGASQPLANQRQVPDASPAPKAEPDEGRVRFEDVAEAAGIQFVLAQPPRAAHGGKRMFESTGAGAGACDFDCDGWPDLFLVQASTEPPGTKPLSPVHADSGQMPGDRLLRNLGTREAGATPQFEDVSARAGIAESEFGQGVAISDLNSDGFDDVYVCNFGRNQLWLNQGDGTFVDGNGLFPDDAEPQWTVSAAIADIDGDGRPEIYDANYVSGDDVVTRLCEVSGKPRVCPPLVFTPAPHALWLADQKGRFHAFSGEGAQSLHGYGLGVVAFKATDSPLPQIFVAIDQQANLLFTVHVSAPADGDSNAASESAEAARDGGLVLQEEAIVRGAAFDASGQSQACMGIATGDVNRDGQVDLYITNFYNESNTLYLQDGGFYRDATAEYNLVAPSLSALGFGTQFSDCDLDGRNDIVVLNGHIDDLTHIKTPYRMRPQVYRQTKSGKFEELAGEAVGKFFTKPALARTLAKVDFNRDGREDLIATDLEAPLALLENRSEAVGKSIAVQLVGTKSDRNAFFTQAALHGPGFQSKQQLVAGGGYMASNERVLRFAAPKEAAGLTLELQWPCGASETCHGLQPGYSYIVVEGRGIVQSFSAESK